ncbi:hypothetical protein GC177_04435 [bacterium]|nr:hypothetical protein [bacterium]
MQLESIRSLGTRYNRDAAKHMRLELCRDVETGKFHLVKEMRSAAHTQNAHLAQVLYELAGVLTPKMEATNLPDSHAPALAAEYLGDNIRKLNMDSVVSGHADEFLNGFIVDCWLANWDVIGGYSSDGPEADNIADMDGKAYRMDTGGALLFRGFGDPKGPYFGNDSTEPDNFRNPNVNWVASRWFKYVTDEHIKTGIKAIAAIPDEIILRATQAYGPGNAREKAELATTIINRKNFLIERYEDLFTAAEKDELTSSISKLDASLINTVIHDANRSIEADGCILSVIKQLGRMTGLAQ